MNSSQRTSGHLFYTKVNFYLAKSWGFIYQLDNLWHLYSLTILLPRQSFGTCQSRIHILNTTSPWTERRLRGNKTNGPDPWRDFASQPPYKSGLVWNTSRSLQSDLAHSWMRSTNLSQSHVFVTEAAHIISEMNKKKTEQPQTKHTHLLLVKHFSLTLEFHLLNRRWCWEHVIMCHLPTSHCSFPQWWCLRSPFTLKITLELVNWIKGMQMGRWLINLVYLHTLNKTSLQFNYQSQFILLPCSLKEPMDLHPGDQIFLLPRPFFIYLIQWYYLSTVEQISPKLLIAIWRNPPTPSSLTLRFWKLLPPPMILVRSSSHRVPNELANSIG